MKNANRIFTGLFLIVALILIIQPASATTQSYLDPGYSYEIGYVASGSWQVYDLVVTNTDDYDILALAYNHVNNFDLYVYDTTTNTYITSATAPYSTENGITYIWAISTLKPGTYSVRIHSNGGAGNFAFIHFYNRQPIQRTVGTTTYTTTSPVTTPVTTSPVSTNVLSSVTQLIVSSVQTTWDADIQYDGNDISLYFMDAESKPVEWQNGPNVPVTIEIWTTESVAGTLQQRKVQLVYQKSGIMTRTIYRFRVPFEDTPVLSGAQSAAVYAKATTPDGKTYEAMQAIGLTPLN